MAYVEQFLRCFRACEVMSYGLIRLFFAYFYRMEVAGRPTTLCLLVCLLQIKKEIAC